MLDYRHDYLVKLKSFVFDRPNKDSRVTDEGCRYYEEVTSRPTVSFCVAVYPEESFVGVVVRHHKAELEMKLEVL